MTDRYLYPRVGLPAARLLYDEHLGMSLSELHTRGKLLCRDQYTAATGGTPVSDERLAAIQSGLREIAEQNGWPNPPSQKQARRFDADGAAFLFDSMGVIPADAGADEVWMHMALVLAPEIPPWRWPTLNERRFLAHPRNTFRNMYWRAYVLGDDRLKQLGEDEIVAVIERPSLSANPYLARMFYDLYLPIRSELKQATPMFLVRDYAKRVRRLTPFLALDTLSDEDLSGVLSDCLDESLAAFGEDLRIDRSVSPSSTEDVQGAIPAVAASSSSMAKAADLAVEPESAPSIIEDESREADLSAVLLPYRSWSAGRLPDPLTTPIVGLVDALVEVVGVEGPVTMDRVFRIFDGGGKPARKSNPIWVALHRARMRSHKELESESFKSVATSWPQRVLRRRGSKPVVARELGPRKLYEVPLDEVARMVTLGHEIFGPEPPAVVKRVLLDEYGLTKANRKDDEFLSAAVRLAGY